MCLHEGFPLAVVPGANVFFTDQDASTPPRPDGSRVVSCHQVSAFEALKLITRAGRLLSSLAEF